MSDAQEQFDDATFAFTTGDYDAAIAGFEAILLECPDHFDSQLSLGMAYCRKGDHDRAVEEGHKAEKLRPDEQLVHTNLSLFYVKLGNKEAAERHGLKARIASWKQEGATPSVSKSSFGQESVKMAQPNPQNIKLPGKFPDMPWRKRKTSTAGDKVEGSNSNEPGSIDTPMEASED